MVKCQYVTNIKLLCDSYYINVSAEPTLLHVLLLPAAVSAVVGLQAHPQKDGSCAASSRDLYLLFPGQLSFVRRMGDVAFQTQANSDTVCSRSRSR